MARLLSSSRADAVKVAATLLSFTLIAVILYTAKVVLIPVALAIMLTFILSPVVTRLDRRGFKRVPAVLCAVGTAGLLLTAMLLLVASQLHSLATDLPNYRENIAAKISALRQQGGGGAIENVRSTLNEVTRKASEVDDKLAELGQEQIPEGQNPMPVRIVPEAGPEAAIRMAVASALAFSPALEGLATGALALVLVIFMLIKREDLRNRMVSFTADGSLAITTKALDDTGQRISRYLIMQLIINGTFGLAVGIGLLIVGVPYAFLWGLCAAVLRYIPYIGPWMAATLPLTVSLITSPGWSQVAFVLGLFLLLELVSNNVIEPWLYGQGIGLSEVALLVSAAFWTWIWGPVGLVLATPLTVCLLVIGKYVNALSFLNRLLGDTPALPAHVVFLQRLLARDADEAADIVRDYRTQFAPDTVYDEVLVPALAMARQERAQGTMNAAEETFVLTVTRKILGELVPEPTIATHPSSTSTDAAEVRPAATLTDMLDRPAAADASTSFASDGVAESGKAAAGAYENGPLPLSPPPIRVLGCAAHQEAEELTLQMLGQLVSPLGMQIDVLSTRILPSDIIERIARERPRVVIIAVLPPGGLIQTRFLCKQLHQRFPDIGIVVGCWRYQGSLDHAIVKLRSAGAHYVTTTLFGARDHALALTRTNQAAEPPVVTQDVAG